jgi:Domain of unknown function (DUF4145)
MNPFNWICPFCNQPTTVTTPNHADGGIYIDLPAKDCPKQIRYLFIACPNPDCRRLAVSLDLHEAMLQQSGYIAAGKLIKKWNLIPSGIAKPFPDYIPKQILEDYNEACDIRDLSPKASATLCRRCLQGMIQDFWKVKKDTLKQQIEAIEDKVDSSDWEAIDSVRKIGNIGAHMEKDVNLIVDVEPEEAQLLIELIKTLFQDWYVTREEKSARNKSLKELAAKKDAERKGVPPS